ncbi:hypothetical protein A0H76_2028 [Hepatospora eriocheir]|uniref:Uncharacterized protein n=1 Tax=Hepatospora eriocheir TaxID=1081669 RepID=A0A1X0QG27_9MICR|nr:hypothetical protein A0H76_2028 [Hepatospora eriocheir]
MKEENRKINIVLNPLNLIEDKKSTVEFSNENVFQNKKVKIHNETETVDIYEDLVKTIEEKDKIIKELSNKIREQEIIINQSDRNINNNKINQAIEIVDYLLNTKSIDLEIQTEQNKNKRLTNIIEMLISKIKELKMNKLS